MTERLPCINLSCKRTGDPAKLPDTKSIICGRCWKALPAALKQRFNALQRRDRRLRRLVEKRAAAGKLPPYRLHVIGGLIDRQLRECSEKIRRYFNNPEKPAGLETFLEEMRL